MGRLVIVGDEAFTEEEYAAYRRKLDAANAKTRERRANDPEFRERLRATWRRYYNRHRKHSNAYRRDWMRNKRTASLSDATLRSRIAWHEGHLERYRAELERRGEQAA